MKKLLGLAVLSMLSFNAFAALEMEMIGDASSKRTYANRASLHDIRLGLKAEFLDSWKIKIKSVAGNSTLDVDLTAQGSGDPFQVGQEGTLSDPTFLTLVDLKGSATPAAFCVRNAIALVPGVSSCAAGDLDAVNNVAITVGLTADIEILGSLKMSVFVAKEHVLVTDDAMTQISVGSDVIAASPAAASHSAMSNLNSLGSGYVTTGYTGSEAQISIPVKVEFPFRGAAFKPSRSDDIVMYAQVESL